MRWWLLVAASACGRLDFDAADSRWPHLPPSCATLREETQLAPVPPAGWTMTGTVDMVADGTAPDGAAAVARFTFATGFTGGVAPGRLIYSPATLRDPATRELYVGVIWKPSSPWQGHSSSDNAILYIEQFDGTTLDASTFDLLGTAEPYHTQTTYNDVPFTRNASDRVVTLGAWHTLELYRLASTTATSADGIMRWWLDGTLVGDHADVNYTQSPFDSVQVNPIWGGVGDAKTETDYYFADRAIVCVP
jgi:hypothetical protein